MIELELDDIEHLLDEVSSFSKGRIHAASQNPEKPMSADTLDQITLEALGLGMLPAGGDGTGIGLWEACTTSEGMAFNIGFLRHVGRANCAVAFAWHRLALARYVERHFGLAPASEAPLGTVLTPVGHHGLARGSLARWISGGAVDADDLVLLADWLDRFNHKTVVVAPENWDVVIWPVWNDGSIWWQRLQRDVMAVDQMAPQHGFDELRAFRLAEKGERGTIRGGDVDNARHLFRSLLALDMIGQLAIGAGAIERGVFMAREYAGMRRQGGRTIDQHPAVKQLLSDTEVALLEADLALRALARPAETLNLAEVASARERLHGAFCRAANQVVQVHGGTGYMRDTGPEKLLRDTNMLRLETGGVREIGLFLDGLQRAGG